MAIKIILQKLKIKELPNNILFAILLIGSFSTTTCMQNQKYKEQKHLAEKIDTNKVSISSLLIQLISHDTFEFSNQFKIDSNIDFVFMKTGNLLSMKDKNTIIVTCPKDSTYLVRLYLNDENKLVPIDSAIIGNAFPSQFDIKIGDYNFDNQNDFFIQQSFSNGYGMSRGHLFLVHKLTKKINLLKKSTTYGNLKPDSKRQILYSEEWISREDNGKYIINVVENKWKNGELVLQKRTKNIK